MNDDRVKGKRTNIIFDVAIIGGCVTGLTTALILQEKGLKVAIIEYSEIGFFTSGSYVTHINGNYDSVYFDVLKKMDKDSIALFQSGINEAEHYLQHTIKKYNIKCDFKKIDGYLIAKNNDELHEIKNLENISNIQLNKNSSSLFRLKHTKKIGSEFIINNVKYLAALKEQFLNAGGVIQELARVLKVEGKHVKTVYSTRGKFKAKMVVYTPQTSRVISIKPYDFFPYVSYSVSAELATGVLSPFFAYDMQNPSHRYIFNNDDFNSITVSGEDHKNVKGKIRNSYFSNLQSIISKDFKVKSLIASWSYIYYMTKNRFPVVEFLPGDKSSIVAAGYKPDGMVISYFAAKILIDLIMGNDNPYNYLFKST